MLYILNKVLVFMATYDEAFSEQFSILTQSLSKFVEASMTS